MRLFAALLLSINLAALPLLANDAKEAGKEDLPAAPSRASAAASKPSETPKPETSVIENELQDLRSLVESQMQELEAQRAELKAQQVKMEALEEKLRAAEPSGPVSNPASPPASAATPTETVAMTPGSAASASASPAQEGEVSPLQLRIGSAYITPVGFMDFTSVWRSRDGGSGIGTNFAGIPYGNTTVQSNLNEFRFSMQNSRIGFRVDASVKGAHVIGYMESDFLGNNPGNVAVSSNSNTLRSRLYWADLRKGAWEILGGQTWSLATPNRVGVSPLPGDVFFSYNMDVNYQLGMVWGRIPELRLAYHFPSDKAAFAIALDSPEQYIGGSAGGGFVTLPAAFAASCNASATGCQLNNGNTTLGVPNSSPDVVAKFVLDPSKKFHFEVGGLERQFQTFNPGTTTKFTKTGGGGFVNLDFELLKGFRLLTHNFWSDGGGRYIFGQAPDLIVRADGSPSLVHTGSSVDGFEYTHKNLTLFGYYGGLYIRRNVAIDTGGTLIGYGFSGSPSGQNRTVQEGTFGFIQNFWKDAKYGALSLIGQYSYLTRDPWAIAVGAPKNSHLSMAFLDLRYTLPGSAPTLGKPGKE